MPIIVNGEVVYDGNQWVGGSQYQSAGNLYYVDEHGNTVQTVDTPANRQLIAARGYQVTDRPDWWWDGSSPWQFNPDAIRYTGVDGDGNLTYWDDTRKENIKLSPEGSIIRGYSTSFNSPDYTSQIDVEGLLDMAGRGAGPRAPLPSWMRAADPLAAPGDIPEWAKSAFFSQGYSFRDFGLGLPGGQVDTSQGTAAQRDALAVITSTLGQVGMSGLAPWIWDRIIEGKSDAEIYAELRETPLWKDRFGLYNESRRKAGLQAMSEAEIYAYEQGVRALLRQWDLPEGFFDQATDIAFLAGNNISLSELNDRIAEGFGRVTTLPPEVRGYFADIYGPGSDAALAAMFLDPEAALPVLERKVNASVVGGIGRRYGFDIGQGRAEDLGAFGVDTVEEAATGFQRIDAVRDLLTERMTESEDYTADQEGFDFAFGLGGGGERRLRGRLDERVADFSGSAGTGVGRGGSTLGQASLTPARRS